MISLGDIEINADLQLNITDYANAPDPNINI